MYTITPEELIEKGILYFRLVQLDLGIPLLEEAFQKALAQGQYQIAMKAQTYLLRGWAEKGNHLAISKLKEELFQFIQSNSISPSAQFYYTLGICGFYEGKLGEAKYYFDKALIASGDADMAIKAQAEVGLSIVEIEGCRYDEALERLNNTKTMIHNYNLHELMVMILLNEGRLYRLKNDNLKALSVFKKAIEIDKYQKNLFGYLYLLYEISLTYFNLNKFDFSQMYLDLAKSTVNEMELTRLVKLIHSLQEKISNCCDYDLQVNTNKRTIIDKYRGEISLNRQEIVLDVLIYLIKNQGRSATKEELSKAIWNEPYVSAIHDNKIYVTIKRLRDLLETDLKNPKYILNSREGYFLNQTLKVAINSQLCKPLLV